MRWVTIISDSVYGRYLRSLSPLLALGPSLAFVCCFSLAETAASGFLGRTKEQTSGHCAEYLWIRRHGSICRGHCRDGAFGTPWQRRRHRGSQRTDWIRHAAITPTRFLCAKECPQEINVMTSVEWIFCRRREITETRIWRWPFCAWENKIDLLFLLPSVICITGFVGLAVCDAQCPGRC